MFSAARIVPLLLLAALQHASQPVLRPAPQTAIQFDDRQFADGRSRVLFTIPEAESYRGVVWRSTEPRRGVRIRSGRLEGVPGTFVVTETEGSRRARLHVRDKVYRIRQERGQPAQIEDISGAGPRPCDTTPRQGQAPASAGSPVSAGGVAVDCEMDGPNDPCRTVDAAMAVANLTAIPPLSAACSRSPSGKTKVVIDVMVVYSSDVGAQHTAEEIREVVEEDIEETNAAFDNSHVLATLRLARRQTCFLTPPKDCLVGFQYDEHGSVSRDLSALLTRDDGELEGVHKLREQCGADVVLMFLEKSTASGKACVMKMLTQAFGEYAMGVVNFHSSQEYYTFTHELGHLMGGGHESTARCERPGMCDDSKGTKFFANGLLYKSMMAYDATPALAFSGPDVIWEGVPTGTAGDTNNARALRISAKTVAAFR